MCTEVHRKEVKLNGAVDWRLMYHFIKGRGGVGRQRAINPGEGTRNYMGELREGQGYLISILVWSVHANSFLLSRDKNKLLTHILRRHCMQFNYVLLLGRWGDDNKLCLHVLILNCLKLQRGIFWGGVVCTPSPDTEDLDIIYDTLLSATLQNEYHFTLILKTWRRRNFSDACCWTNDRIIVWTQTRLA